MLEQLDNTIGVEHVATAELRAGFGTELTRVADSAEFVLIGALEVSSLLSAVSVEAWKALALFRDTLAGVATLFMGLLTEGKSWLLLRHNHHLLDFFLLVFFDLFWLINCSDLDIDLQWSHGLIGSLAGQSWYSSFKHRLRILMVSN